MLGLLISNIARYFSVFTIDFSMGKQEIEEFSSLDSKSTLSRVEVDIILPYLKENLFQIFAVIANIYGLSDHVVDIYFHVFLYV